MRVKTRDKPYMKKENVMDIRTKKKAKGPVFDSADIEEVKIPSLGEDGSSSPIIEEEVGGIDLNPNELNMQVESDGKGVTVPIAQPTIELMNVQGFVPVIINVAPIINLLPMLGLADHQDPFDTAQGDRSYDLSQLNPINRIERFKVEELESVSLLS